MEYLAPLQYISLPRGQHKEQLEGRPRTMTIKSSRPTSTYPAGHESPNPNRTQHLSVSFSISLHNEDAVLKIQPSSKAGPLKHLPTPTAETRSSRSGLYTHSNTSGVLPNQDQPSPTVTLTVTKNSKKPFLRRQSKHKRSPCPSLTSHSPSSSSSPSLSPSSWLSHPPSPHKPHSTHKPHLRSLIRSRIKIWNVSRLGYASGLVRIHEEDEGDHEYDADAEDSKLNPKPNPSSTKLWPSKHHPNQLELRLPLLSHRLQPRAPTFHLSTEGQSSVSTRGSSESVRVNTSDTIEVKDVSSCACPMFIIDEDEESDSSSSDSSYSSSGSSLSSSLDKDQDLDLDLDAYNFDVSSCYPSSPLDMDMEETLKMGSDSDLDFGLGDAIQPIPMPLKSTYTNPTGAGTKPRRTKTVSVTPKAIINHHHADSISDSEPCKDEQDSEIDISSVYASIMRDTSLLVRPSWM